MVLNPVMMQASIASFMPPFLIIGPSVPQLSLGIANGLVSYLQTVTVVTVDVGTFGVGVGTGIGLVLPPPILAGALLGTFVAASIAGVMSIPLIGSISLGVSLALTAVNIVTGHPTVGSGSGAATVIPTGATQYFISGFAAAGMTGAMAIPMATAIANGFDIALPSAKGVVVIAGPPNSSPSSGAGVGVLK